MDLRYLTYKETGLRGPFRIGSELDGHSPFNTPRLVI